VGDWIKENQDGIVNFLIALKILGELKPLILGLALAIIGLLSPLGEIGLIIGGLAFVIANFEDSFRMFITLSGQFLVIVSELMRKVIMELGGKAYDFWMAAYNAVMAFVDGFNQVWDWFVGNAKILLNNFINLIRDKMNIHSLAYNAMLAFANEFFRVFDWFIDNVWIKFRNFIAWLKALLGIASPSKVFEEMGKQTIEGYAKGIMEGFAMPEKAMSMAISHTLTPVVNAMMPSMGGATTNTTNNFALNVTSNAQREPLMADFRMLQSLVSV
jgi:hypothetical protein